MKATLTTNNRSDTSCFLRWKCQCLFSLISLDYKVWLVNCPRECWLCWFRSVSQSWPGHVTSEQLLMSGLPLVKHTNQCRRQLYSTTNLISNRYLRLNSCVHFLSFHHFFWSEHQNYLFLIGFLSSFCEWFNSEITLSRFLSLAGGAEVVECNVKDGADGVDWDWSGLGQSPTTGRHQRITTEWSLE